MNLAILGKINFMYFRLFEFLFFFRQVLDIVAAVRNDDPVELSEIVYKNTERLFFSQ